jgi:hypothetical protein
VGFVRLFLAGGLRFVVAVEVIMAYPFKIIVIYRMVTTKSKPKLFDFVF